MKSILHMVYGWLLITIVVFLILGVVGIAFFTVPQILAASIIVGTIIYWWSFLCFMKYH